MKKNQQSEILSILPDIFPENWAHSYGQDHYGIWQGIFVNKIEIRFRWIPPREFMMGSPEDEPERYDDEGPLHRVAFEKGFWLGETACTQELWQAVTGKNPSIFEKEGPEHPVENVSWDDANAFIDRLNSLVSGLGARLPSEAEWEYACRAGTDTPFWFGRELTPDKANYAGTRPYNKGPKGEYRQKTVPVKFFEQNPWGLYQMHGNVWEWCQDRWHGNYNGAPEDGSAWEEGDSDSRLCRGGSWLNHGWNLRSAYRHYRPRADLYVNHGLRLARGPQDRSGSGTGWSPGKGARDERKKAKERGK
ncbi:MAG: formylglycine-generating enzyme family protein [Desulfobacter postgatei]|uniref:formylglycine-generating enzyme family protein n=1 Tax=Desulfobacter postgatei TaxID=2293 RepID=UPI0023F19F2E|nr:formylglycine-generating enzyme family protein [Desulfobacter postgatei]MDD4272185.1 formylglycine-generating enzyme family protein [Desulfobacter postgatei]